MIIIDDKLISEDILTSLFHCNLFKCKGQCCVEGVCGAPLEENEKIEIEKSFPFVVDKLSQEAQNAIQEQGKFLNLPEHGLVTPTIGSGEGVCAYAIKDKKGTVLCAFEQAYLEKKTSWKKPLSCHLFPIRISKTKFHEILNYEKIDICESGCSLGKQQKSKLYVFLKEAIIRKYGKDFYEAIERIDKEFVFE